MKLIPTNSTFRVQRLPNHAARPRAERLLRDAGLRGEKAPCKIHAARCLGFYFFNFAHVRNPISERRLRARHNNAAERKTSRYGYSAPTGKYSAPSHPLPTAPSGISASRATGHVPRIWFMFPTPHRSYTYAVTILQHHQIYILTFFQQNYILQIY